MPAFDVSCRLLMHSAYFRCFGAMPTRRHAASLRQHTPLPMPRYFSPSLVDTTIDISMRRHAYATRLYHADKHEATLRLTAMPIYARYAMRRLCLRYALPDACRSMRCARLMMRARARACCAARRIRDAHDARTARDARRESARVTCRR